MGWKEWNVRWKEGRVGFHAHEPNDFLVSNFTRLGLPTGSHVLVPLCGKSVDMVWIAGQSHRVTGIDFSPIAINDFLHEQELSPREEPLHNRITCYRDDPFTLLHGDFLKLDPRQIDRVDWIYDRGGLVSLPPSEQVAYVAHLVSFLSPDQPLFLITFDYDVAKMEGPPFSLGPKEIEKLFSSHFQIEVLERREEIEKNPRFSKRGLKKIWKGAYLLRRNRRTV